MRRSWEGWRSPYTPPTPGSDNTAAQRFTIETGRASVAFLRTDAGTIINLVWLYNKDSDIPALWYRSANTEQHLSAATLAHIEGRTITIDADTWRAAGGHPIARLRVVGDVVAAGRTCGAKVTSCQLPRAS